MNMIPLVISTIEMGSLWQGNTYPKNAAILLNGACVNRRGLDLSKEVLWVSVGQRTAKLQVVKVGDLKKILPLEPHECGLGSIPGR